MVKNHRDGGSIIPDTEANVNGLAIRTTSNAHRPKHITNLPICLSLLPSPNVAENTTGGYASFAASAHPPFDTWRDRHIIRPQ